MLKSSKLVPNLEYEIKMTYLSGTSVIKWKLNWDVRVPWVKMTPNG